jgi:nicotinate (nicotinamide) nucleotide adenylyltransferase
MKKENKRIIVMGGSFNPPTSAHLRLMKEAVDALNADIGFFVPVSDAYLKRKMRHSHPPVVLSPEMRVRMLQSMCADDSRLQVCEKEIGTIEPRTMPTLQALQEDYPEAELYFVMGADKFDLLASLAKKRQFLDAFKVVLYSRDGAALEQSIEDDEVLSNYLDRMVILPQPEGTEGVSSSLVRERMLRGECSSDLLCPGVWDLFKEYTPADFPDSINRFKGEYDFLSNRYPCHIVWEGLKFRSAEAAFQASKCKDEKERKVFAGCSTDKAVLKGKNLTPYPGWEEAQTSIMESILQAKFEQNPALMRKLAETGNRVLLNGNNKQETFWGIDLYSWIGENHLGRIIMNIRDKEINTVKS